MSALAMLQRGLNERRLVIVAGAGVSIAPPSNLPSWWGFNVTLLEAIKKQATNFLPQAEEVIHQLNLDRIPIQAFSDLIVDGFAGDSYFPLLRVLESDRTNANHLALAELGASGKLQAVVTPNFDTLIERAFREAGVNLTLFITREHFQRPDRAGACRLFKIHGSVTADSTLVDTVSQKSCGLPVYLTERLQAEFATAHVLVIGFSGSDLQFDDAYLPFEVAAEKGLGVTWLIRPNSRGKMPSRAASLIERMGAKCSVVEAELPGFFEVLDIQVNRMTNEHKDQAAYLNEQFERWLQEPHIGAPTCAAFCARLFQECNDRNSMKTILDAISKHPDVSGPTVSFQSGLCFRILGSASLERGDYQEAELWFEKDLRFHQHLQKLLDHDLSRASAAGRLERHRNLGAVWNNLGVCRRLSHRYLEANSALEQASYHAHAAGDSRRVGSILLNRALIEISTKSPPDEVIDILTAAQEHARHAGDIRCQAECLLQRARTLTFQGEYHAAELDLAAVDRIVGIIGNVYVRLQLEFGQAELLIRRGDERKAYDQLADAITTLGDTPLACTGRWFLATRLMHSAELRGDVNRQLDALLTAANIDGRINLHGQTITKEIVEGCRTSLTQTEGKNSSYPIFLLQLKNVLGPNRDDQSEDFQRAMLMFFEYSRRPCETTSLLIKLANCYYARPSHMLRLARACVTISEQCGDTNNLRLGLNAVGIASDNLGMVGTGIIAFERSLSLAEDGAVRANLTLAQTRFAGLQEARHLFENCIAQLDNRKEVEHATRTRMNYARRLADEGLFEDAIRIATSAREAATGLDDKRAVPTLEFFIGVWRHRLSNGRPSIQPFDSAAFIEANRLEALANEACTAPELGNVGLAEMEVGRYDAARSHIGQALKLYEVDGDQIGMSRCYNNLASLAAFEDKFDQAIEWAKFALVLRRGQMDFGGVAITLSNLVVYAWRAKRYEDVVRYADECRAIEIIVPAAREYAVAWAYRMMAHLELQQPSEARQALTHARKWQVSARDSQIEQMLAELEKVLPSSSGPSQLQAMASRIEGVMRAISRLKDTEKFADALAALDEALAAGGWTDVELAAFMGTRGNIYQRSGSHAMAVECYDQAAAEFERFGDSERARSARLNTAASLRELGRDAEARALMSQILEGLADGPDRAFALCSLAKAIWLPLAKRNALPENAALIAEALDLYRQAGEQSGVRDEMLGIIALDVGQLLLSTGDNATGTAKLREAKGYFIDANSPHQDTVSRYLQDLENHTHVEQ